MSKKRLYEIAKELGKESKEVVARAKELGLDVKSHSSSVEGLSHFPLGKDEIGSPVRTLG